MFSIGIFISLIVFFLPYTECLVLDLGFPFKIYELLGIILFFLILLSILKGKSFVVRITKYEKLIYFSVFTFFFLYCVSVIIGKYNLKLTDLPLWAVGRYAPGASGITRVLYLVFNISLFILFNNYIRNKVIHLRLLKIWIISSFFVSLYAIYLFLFSLYNKPLLLPGLQGSQYIGVPGLGSFIRNATFKEGNIFGSYMLVSLLITLPFIFIKNREFKLFPTKRVLLIFLLQMTALFISYSAINIVAFVITLFFFFAITRFKSNKVYVKNPFLKVSFVLAILIFLFLEFGAHKLFYQKIFGNDSFWSYSRKDRLNMVITAVKMANKNLIFGVGPGNYGYYYNEFTDVHFRDTTNKRIAGNIYAEILCENGILGFLSYSFFIILMIRIFFVRKKNIMECCLPVVNGLFCGLIGILLAYIAFPTFTLTFHWVLMALLLSSIRVLQINDDKLDTAF